MRPVLQCFFRINASRDMFRITNREATAIQQRSPVGFAVDGEIFLLAGFPVATTTRLLPSSVWREAVSIAFYQPHNPSISDRRNKQIHRRTRFNLTGQSR